MKDKIMKIKSNIFVLLVVVLFFSCEEVVTIDLENGESTLVIDAEILWQKETEGNIQSIEISRMADYYSDEIPKVSGASVNIENSRGDVFIFSESEVPGRYVCDNFLPELNETYVLNVVIQDQTFIARETLVAAPEVTRIEQDIEVDFGEEKTEIIFYFDDIEGESNFYLSDLHSGVLVSPIYNLLDDEFSDGNELEVSSSDERLLSGNTVEINFRSISERFYNYMNMILEASDSNPFATPPANIRGNIINLSDPNNYALGYFRLSQSEHISYIVH